MVSGVAAAGTSIARTNSFEARAGARGRRESLQGEQVADERFRQTGRKRRKDRGHNAELHQAARDHHLGVSNVVDIFLRLARYYPLLSELGCRSMASGAASKVRDSGYA